MRIENNELTFVYLKSFLDRDLNKSCIRIEKKLSKILMVLFYVSLNCTVA